MTTQDFPDRVSMEQESPHYWAGYVNLGVRIDGVEVHNVAEFCISEGWVRRLRRLNNGKIIRERGRISAPKVHCNFEVYWRERKATA